MRKIFSGDEKLEAVKRRLEGKESISQIAESIGTVKQTVDRWIMKYESMGAEAFSQSNRKYSLELKTEAVEYYLYGQASQRDTCKKFKINSQTQLQRWIVWYNEGSLKASPGGKTAMARTKAKGRKTTFEERISIVEDHIRSGMSYAETAEKYHVSYQQVYQWVQKYNTQGIDGLKDKRGRTKPEEEMTELEKLKAENRMLKAKLERKELENLFLKKLDEIERRRS